MYILLHDGSGDQRSEIQSSVTWYYALALRSENLHEMNPASSEPSYDGHGELKKHCVPACPVLVTHYSQVAVQTTEKVQHHIMPAKTYQDGYLWGRGIAKTYMANLRGNHAQARGNS